MLSYRSFLTGLVVVALLIGCSNSPTAPISSPRPVPHAHRILSALLNIGKPPANVSAGIALSPTDSSTSGGGFQFADAECSEQLTLTFDSTATVINGDTTSVAGTLTGVEVCIYYADGRVTAPGHSPLGGPDGTSAPFTGQLWADSISLHMLYHNPKELVPDVLPATVPVDALGAFADSAHVGGPWVCTGQCGSTGQGATGTWTMVVQQ